MRMQLYQQLIKPVTRIYYYFFVYENCNAKIIILVVDIIAIIASSNDCIYMDLIFFCKICNKRAIMLAANQASHTNIFLLICLWKL